MVDWISISAATKPVEAPICKRNPHPNNQCRTFCQA